jgi:sugar phosphate isomerase/epimerase
LSDGEERRLEIAAHTWGVPVLANPEESIPQLRAEGVTAIEDGYPFFVTYPESVVEENARRYREAGIRIWSVHAPFGGTYSLSHPDDDVRRRAVEYHKFVLTRVALAGAPGAAPMVVLHPSNGGLQVEEIPRLIPGLLHSLEDLLPVAEGLGVRLGLENMLPRHVGSDFEELRQIVEEIGSPWLRVCFDSGHAHVAGGVQEGLETLKDLVATFHLADNDGTRDMHLQPPYGTIPWEDFRTVFRTMDFQSPIVVETKPWQDDGYGQLCREVSALLEGNLLTVPVPGAIGANGAATGRVQCLRCGHLRFGSAEHNWCACPADGG